MPPITRREFLKTLSAALGATTAANLLSACGGTASGQGGTQPAMRPAAATQAANANSTLTNSSANAPAAAPAGTPDLVVARQGQPEALVREAIDALGGMKRFVSPGASVVIKPNICVAYHTYEYAATTNPWVVGALVKLALEAGASKVSVFDYPFGGTAQEAYSRSGIAEQVQAAGGRMLDMPAFKFMNTDLPNAKDLKKAKIFEDALNADVLIDAPIAKTHRLARLTLGMKNLMGLIYDRQAIHRSLGPRLADLASFLRPDLVVIDAVRILTANGPTGGNLDDVKELNTLIASTDIVAADSYASGLFGLQPSDLAYVNAGVEAGLGQSDLSQLNIQELNLGG
jgi:uncharacterized protein (DUF362 family)